MSSVRQTQGDTARMLLKLQEAIDELAAQIPVTSLAPPTERWQTSSCVGKMKQLYREASKGQRAMMRSWMGRVLTGEDGKP